MNVLLSPSELEAQVEYLKTCPQPEQRTPEWFRERQTRVTASEAASCLVMSESATKVYREAFGLSDLKLSDKRCVNPYMSTAAYIKRKCDDFHNTNTDGYKDNVFTLWGKKYEEVANRLYAIATNKNVNEFGLISHSSLEWLAASPDGITDDGIMVEIKCPKSRKINEIVPFYYWVQTQIQLECCGLEECNFVQCEISEFDSAEDYYSCTPTTDQQKGILLAKSEKDIESGEWIDLKQYIYPPIYNYQGKKRDLTTKEYASWIADMREIHDDGVNNIVLKEHYFLIYNYNIIRIPRSREWFNAVKNDIKAVWDRITELQQNRQMYDEFVLSTSPIVPKLPEVCMID